MIAPMKYMVIVVENETGLQHAMFTNDYNKADNMRMDAEVGLGYFAQIYEWLPDPEFPHAAELYMWSYKEI